ncbi:MAG: hypothetical protein ABSF44_13220 [Candidatus Bathyarchaeia archaeon]|jgi:hypothetical protein
MSEVILEKSNNAKRKTCLIGHPDTTRTHTHWPVAFSYPEDLTNAYLLENKKSAVLKRLEHAHEKLKDAREEINEAVLAALEMKEARDDIADQMTAAIVARGAIRNAEITLSQAQTKIEHLNFEHRNVDSKQAKEEKMELPKKNLSITADFVIVKGVSLEERRIEAEKPLYLARYE